MACSYLCPVLRPIIPCSTATVCQVSKLDNRGNHPGGLLFPGALARGNGRRLVRGLGRHLGAQLVHLTAAEALQELLQRQVLAAVCVRRPEDLLQLLRSVPYNPCRVPISGAAVRVTQPSKNSVALPAGSVRCHRPGGRRHLYASAVFLGFQDSTP